jgi:outer membrane protein assembly factor BamB
VHDILVLDVERPDRIAQVNSYASPTPAIEAGRVYLHYGTYGTACLDTNTGDVLWKRTDLNCDHHMGPGSSPILFGGLLIFQVDGIDVQYVVALDKTTGETAWRTDRSVDYTDIHRFTRKSFCTPRVIRVDGRDELISPGSKAVMAYDPLTGDELWKVRYFGWSMVARPLFGHGLAFVVIDYDHPELWAIRPGGSGDVTDERVVWKLRKGVPSTPSLLLIDDLLYMVSDLGVASCVEAATGRIVWQQRVHGDYSASPVYADGRIFLTAHDATTTVIRPGRQFQQLAVNRLDGQCRASAAVADGALFVRTEAYLYRIEQGK